MQPIKLPAANIARWTLNAKLAVCEAIGRGELDRNAAKARYSLTDEELDGWERRLFRHGLPGLRATRLQQYR